MSRARRCGSIRAGPERGAISKSYFSTVRPGMWCPLIIMPGLPWHCPFKLDDQVLPHGSTHITLMDDGANHHVRVVLG